MFFETLRQSMRKHYYRASELNILIKIIVCLSRNSSLVIEVWYLLQRCQVCKWIERMHSLIFCISVVQHDFYTFDVHINLCLWITRNVFHLNTFGAQWKLECNAICSVIRTMANKIEKTKRRRKNCYCNRYTGWINKDYSRYITKQSPVWPTSSNDW